VRIYFKVLGGHVHCRVFTTGSKCGDLVFTVKEWPWVRALFEPFADLVEEQTVGGDRDDKFYGYDTETGYERRGPDDGEVKP
jgi:hypothetical protein